MHHGMVRVVNYTMSDLGSKLWVEQSWTRSLFCSELRRDRQHRVGSQGEGGRKSVGDAAGSWMHCCTLESIQSTETSWRVRSHYPDPRSYLVGV